jgi:predicted  nucleic acid-binding Zn-ribbon protein
MRYSLGLFVVSSLTLVLGGVLSLTSGTNGALLGSATGAILGVSIVGQQKDKRIIQIESELRQLQVQIDQGKELKSLGTQISLCRENLKDLKTKVEDLRKEEKNLAAIKGKFTEQRAQLQEIEKHRDTLVQEKQDLENRIAIINQQRPDLSTLEKLHQQTAQFQLDKSDLEGQLTALKSQVENLIEIKNNLKNIELEATTKQSQLNFLNIQVAELQSQTQQLEQQTAKLELLRATYDGLFTEKQNFETRLEQIKPEIYRLEAEKNRILQEILARQSDYEKVQKYREELNSLELEVKNKSSEIRKLQRNIDHLKNSESKLEEQNSQLQQRKDSLEAEIRRLKGEIQEIESSAKLALQSLKEKLWNEKLPTNRLDISNETEFLSGFVKYIQSTGLNFSRRVINAFHTSLKVQDISALVILAGISGTGKSQLPQRYAEYIGAQLLVLPVQPRWDSPQDLQGFYNYVEKKFKPTTLMQGLYQYKTDEGMQDRIVIVLLDEMNLARVEYYFSDFLSKLETRRHKETYLDIDVGSLSLPQSERQLKIPHEFLFVGTMNEDETTQSLSDKVLDRSNVLTFGKPQNLNLLQENQRISNSHNYSSYLPYSDFRKWIKIPDPNSMIIDRLQDILNRTNNLMESMGHPFAHRVYQAIIQYVVNYPGVEEIDSPAFKFAIADQFGQKLLPKLRGVMVDEMNKELDELDGIITEIDDNPLILAFKKARLGRYGQFYWQGLVYQDE